MADHIFEHTNPVWLSDLLSKYKYPIEQRLLTRSWHACQGCEAAHYYHHHTADVLFLACFENTFDYLCVISALSEEWNHYFIVKLMDNSTTYCSGKKKNSYFFDILRSEVVISTACFTQS